MYKYSCKLIFICIHVWRSAVNGPPYTGIINIDELISIGWDFNYSPNSLQL